MEIAYLAAAIGGLWLFLCFVAGALALGLVGRRFRRRWFESPATGGDRFSFQILWIRKKPRVGIEKNMTVLDRNVEFFFPLEVMFEIFSRLTVATLLRCKGVCKHWNEIIEHPEFIEMHRVRSTELISYNTIRDRLAETFYVLDCCHGLLVEKSKLSGMFRVRNPATKQILALPDPEEKPYAMVIVYIASTNSYKLVSVYRISQGNSWSISLKVLSFGGSNLSWRALRSSYFPEIDRNSQEFFIARVGEFVYFDGSSDSQIHCLDVENEIVRPVTVPQSVFSNLRSVWFMKWDEKAAAVGIVEDKLHVRVLEDPIRQKWAKKMIIIPLTFLKENPNMKKGLVPISASREEIKFRKDNVTVILYSIRSEQVWESKLSAYPWKKSMPNATCSLVTLKGMQPEKKPKLAKIVWTQMTLDNINIFLGFAPGVYTLCYHLYVRFLQ